MECKGVVDGKDRVRLVKSVFCGSHTHYQFILKLMKSVLAVVVDNGATSNKLEGEATVNPPTQSPYNTAYRERC